MKLSEKISNKWENISKSEKSGLKVLIIFVLGVITFSIGIGIGDTLYSIFGK